MKYSKVAFTYTFCDEVASHESLHLGAEGAAVFVNRGHSSSSMQKISVFAKQT